MARLLFDQNLSHRLVRALAEIFPGSLHVRDAGLARADDTAVWQFARDAGLTIVTKDSDFNQMCLVYGPPPRVVWLRIGNCATDDVLGIIRYRASLSSPNLRRRPTRRSSLLILPVRPFPPTP
jgi:predicted nuclease of predicted toxin-antitoxin system